MASLRHQALVAVVIVLAVTGSAPVDSKRPCKPHHHTSHHGHKIAQHQKTILSFPFLATEYYDFSCFGGVSKIFGWIEDLVNADNTLPAAWTRLHFHDCFVHGCDASIMINNGDPNNEINALPNKNSIRGLTELNSVKAKIEAYCPGTVSCADLIALAARDSIQVLTKNTATWAVPLGRKDGSVSVASDANNNLPAPFANLSDITQKFAAQGLTQRDMTILSGAHTIGFTHCAFVTGRLYNFPNSTNGVDPTLDPTLAQSLQQQCPNGGPPGTRILMEPTFGGQKFDSNYFSGVKDNKGVFTSDAALKTSVATLDIVNAEALTSTFPFFVDFGLAMQKMGMINVLTGNQGNVRLDCSKFNS